MESKKPACQKCDQRHRPPKQTVIYMPSRTLDDVALQVAQGATSEVPHLVRAAPLMAEVAASTFDSEVGGWEKQRQAESWQSSGARWWLPPRSPGFCFSSSGRARRGRHRCAAKRSGYPLLDPSLERAAIDELASKSGKSFSPILVVDISGGIDPRRPLGDSTARRYRALRPPFSPAPRRARRWRAPS